MMMCTHFIQCLLLHTVQEYGMKENVKIFAISSSKMYINHATTFFKAEVQAMQLFMGYSHYKVLLLEGHIGGWALVHPLIPVSKWPVKNLSS